MIALTHVPSSHLGRCQLTFVGRAEIDPAEAARQHAAYCQTLRDCGAKVVTLDVNRDHPDGVFIEDVAVVLDEVAILTPMGTPARAAEPAGVEPVLRRYREVHRIDAPATLEGGDVLRVGRRLLVGRSCRTNDAGVAALAAVAGRYGYEIVPVRVHGSLHLKTAVTALDDERLLVNPAWVDAAPLAGFEQIPVPPAEPWAANVARVGGAVVLAAEHPRTAELIRRLGFDARPVALSEFAKAEGGVTCLSILFDAG